MGATNTHLSRAAWLSGVAGVRGGGVDLLRSLLVCPVCRGGLEWQAQEARCTGCGAVYGIADGIPVLRRTEPAAAGEQKDVQASFFDEADPEFEVTRPHGTPWLYRWLLAEKFRRSLEALPLPAEGLTAATICGGSGMDAEFLVRVGASVISTDISLGAAQRTGERARRFGFDVLPVVADAEALPLRDRSVDLLYVHDGLHHLDSPAAGIREMLRTSRLAISINEPARAGATMLAARVGLSEHYEEAGNFIARVDPEQLAAEVEAAGFEVVRNERYAMVYRHEPGRAALVLSQPGLRHLTRAALGTFNAVAGGVGNKLTLQAVRTDAA
ncbi:MAG TPA: methyltransferase domain-containing protein [Gaiellaceae bacterium]|nr:methyltransferase domain-containing protein [Gaiellaceae bacterium]